jgi:RNA polymerase sigma-70 factor (ECF subfamily)
MVGSRTSVAATGGLATVQPSEQSWGALVGRMALGDESALAALYEATAAVVHGLVLRIVSDRGTAEEVTADVFHQAWRQAARFDPRRGTAPAWLLTIARTRAIDRLRATADRAVREPIELAAGVASAAPGPEDALGLAQRRDLVRNALGTLAPDQRQAVELAYFAGLSHTEIAARLNEPLGTVKTRIRLAMARLRNTLATSGGPRP